MQVHSQLMLVLGARQSQLILVENRVECRSARFKTQVATPTTSLSMSCSVSASILRRWCINLRPECESRWLPIIRVGQICMPSIGGVILDGNDRLSSAGLASQAREDG